jgi:hypothetical protein
MSGKSYLRPFVAPPIHQSPPPSQYSTAPSPPSPPVSPVSDNAATHCPCPSPSPPALGCIQPRVSDRPLSRSHRPPPSTRDHAVALPGPRFAVADPGLAPSRPLSSAVCESLPLTTLWSCCHPRHLTYRHSSRLQLYLLVPCQLHFRL